MSDCLGGGGENTLCRHPAISDCVRTVALVADVMWFMTNGTRWRSRTFTSLGWDAVMGAPGCFSAVVSVFTVASVVVPCGVDRSNQVCNTGPGRVGVNTACSQSPPKDDGCPGRAASHVPTARPGGPGGLAQRFVWVVIGPVGAQLFGDCGTVWGRRRRRQALRRSGGWGDGGGGEACDGPCRCPGPITWTGGPISCWAQAPISSHKRPAGAQTDPHCAPCVRRPAPKGEGGGYLSPPMHPPRGGGGLTQGLGGWLC